VHDVRVEAYTDQYGPRLALRYEYNPDTNAILKDEIGFPGFKWDKDKKAWSVQQNSSTIAKAVDLLQDRDYNCSSLIEFADSLPKNVRGSHECWTKVSGTRLFLHWPYISDESLRETVRLTVRSIGGRKFHKEQKCWSIPVAQARTLHTMLEDSYPCLAKAITENDEVKDEVKASIERIEMSSAALLDDSKMDEITARLEGKFPEGLGLYPFQKVAVAFAEASGGQCLIGDEMGIGKTISAIGYAVLHPEARPALVVCPANVKYNWVNELTKWLPDESICIINKGKDEVHMADFIIINYDLMTKKKEALMKLAPRLTIIDEIHYLKNKKAKRTEATLAVAKVSGSVIALSGTAIASRPSEFFNTLNLMRPDQFPSFWSFGQRYCDPYHNGYAWNFDGASNIKELNERTRDLCIRRLKKEVLPELPPKQRTFLPIHLDRDTRRPYDLAQEEWDRRIDDYYLNNEPMPSGLMLNMLSDLRHICGRIKVPYAVNWIGEYHSQTGNPIVVFTHHRDVMSELHQHLKAVKQYAPLTIDVINGDVASKARQDIVDNFQDGQIDVLICNTMAAKEGITLTIADTVLFLEREWVPTDEEQAEDRLHRIGQESSVHAVYISVAGTIDEHFDRVVESKRRVVKAVLDGGTTDERQGLVSELIKKMKDERGWKLEENK
jgi:SWI/SNF-related matrix-associated actin-dependent regulator 1 of chromatin subfamily A